VHRQRGLSEPGRTQAVRAALATRRYERLRAVSGVLEERIRQLPVIGWPHGLFGRRDALILTLVAAGMAFSEIAVLRRGDVRRVGHELMIDSAGQWRIGAGLELSEHNPAVVYSRWARVQEILDGFPNARQLAHYFEHPPAPAADRLAPVLTAAVADQPLIVSIDRWGYTPLRPAPLSRQSISSITGAHLSGEARAHRRPTPQSGIDRVPAVRPHPEQAADAMTLDPRYHLRGVRARRRANAWLTNVGDELDEVASRAEQLLERLAAIVDEAHQMPVADESGPSD
jgi:hypothetical protein